MSGSAWFVIGFAFGSLALLPVFILAFRQIARAKVRQWQRLDVQYLALISEIIENHRLEFEKMIAEMNHHGPVKEGATLAGLIMVISLVTRECLKSLKNHLKQREWNTEDAITTLQSLLDSEIKLSEEQLTKFMKSQRDTLTKFNKFQE